MVLDKIGRLEILRKLYGTILVTREIAEEFELSLPQWVHMEESPKMDLNVQLGPGELSAIAYAYEFGGLIVLDDKKARKTANDLGIDYTGTLGVLVEARLAGFIDSIKPVLEQIKGTDFYISEELEAELIKLCGEEN